MLICYSRKRRGEIEFGKRERAVDAVQGQKGNGFEASGTGSMRENEKAYFLNGI